MTAEEQQPLLSRSGGSEQRDTRTAFGKRTKDGIGKCIAVLRGLWPTCQLLVFPLLLGLILSVATPAEVDAMRSLSCVHYYSLHPSEKSDQKGLDSTSCQAPAVEVHFNSLMTRITISVVLANFIGMLFVGRTFTGRSRKWYTSLGLLGLALGRIPLLIMPLYQYPYLTEESMLSVSPSFMLKVYWACAVLGGFSGANELVTLTVESLAVDTQGPDQRSRLFSQLQVAQLLGATIGPMLGSAAMYAFPSLANRCIGYQHCLENSKLSSPRRGSRADHLLFNTASYWVAVFAAMFGIFWVLCVTNFRNGGENSALVAHCESCERRNAEQKSSSGQPPKYAWLGAFQRLVPVRIRPWEWDARILQFTVSEAFTAMMNEGVVVLILLMGYVFRWGSNYIAIGLTVSNACRLLMIVIGLPGLLALTSRFLSKPEEVSDLAQEQIDVVLSMSRKDAKHRLRFCPEHRNTREARILDRISPKQRTLLRLWRAEVDLMVARLSYFFNAISWLMMAYGVQRKQEWVVLTGAVLLTTGSSAQPMVRSTACTVADQIVDWQDSLLPSTASTPQQQQEDEKANLPDGADSYLVIVSTLLLPCLLVGLLLRNAIYGATVETFPGATFILVAALNIAVLAILGLMRSPPSFYLATY
ncbi:hypothetical protein MPSI1_000446 [Malassezia psittaci]|uniref:Uncharacterized protein n=1 Tax=Malassezia psittaci TaxID=1821823 RepID=A0AAF0F6M7_9BASI|nr:hypothetical protein MPSI1_000446 [Malassezia psittaci]